MLTYSKWVSNIYWEKKMIAAYVAGLFSLLGAFAGAFLARRSDRLKWLMKNRSETFAEFLRLLFEAQEKAINLLHDSSLDTLSREIGMTEVYRVPENYGYVVRLYLPKEHRVELSTLIREVRALHCSVTLGDSRLGTMQKKIDRIQELLENVVHG